MNGLRIVWASSSKFEHLQNPGLGGKAGPPELSGNGLGIVWELSGPHIQNSNICRIWALGSKVGPPELSGNGLGMVWELSGPQIQNLNICRIWAWGRKAGPPELSRNGLGMV